MEVSKEDLLVSSYVYHLPQGSIAQVPAEPRDSAKLLVCHNGQIEHKNISDLPSILSDDYVLFFNNTKVVKARLRLIDVTVVFEQGDRKIINDGEVFFLRALDEYECEVLVRPGKKLRM